nr:hypothetical protein [bacterium]
MTTNASSENKPLWLSMEGMILELADQDLAADIKEGTIRRLALGLDEAGYGVSGHAGHMLELRAAIEERIAAGRPLLKDFDGAVSALQLTDVEDANVAAAKLAVDVGAAFPLLKGLGRRRDVHRIMTQTRLDLLVAKARELGGDRGVRYLIGAEVEIDVITGSLGITRADYDRVDAEMAAERAERKRVTELLEDVDGKDEAVRIKHLIDNDVAEDLIIELAEVDQAAIDGVNKAMEKELAEKKRLAEEEAARKAAEAEGPSLENISNEDMLELIEGIREIMEFSDQPDEIRTMCEQSDMPKCLVAIAVS